MTAEIPATAYKALASELRAAILKGEFPTNRQLPTEAELVASHGLSRQTVRQAFRELVAESLVYRVRGRGTFAAPVGEGTYVRSFGSIDDLLSLSIDTEAELVEPLTLRTDASAAGRLQLTTDQVMACTVRRYHKGLAFSCTRVYLPVDIGRAVASVKELAAVGGRSRVTIIGLIERVAGVPISGAHQSIVAVPAPDDIAKLLDCDPGQPVLQIDRLYFDRNGKFVELAVSRFHPDRYSYRLEIRRSPA
jgi:DNA-binding GntR family transcriptional regulator